ncbi:MAG: hypothetical protein JWM96_265 [Alphaproteobacteria bacterium]|nr:hypothetical protein [Alphaproteobacteria bacterium]
MRHHPITLGVIRPNWSAAKNNRSFGKISPQAKTAVLQRDDYTCQCCGFRAEKHQEVLHINGDTRDFTPENVLTTCIFCHQCFDLGAVEGMHSGMLIWLPEISQVTLHHIMRSVYLGRITQGPLAEMARKIFDAFYNRGAEAKKRLGSTDPGALTIVLRDFLTRKDYEKAQDNLKGIRLLPLDRRMIKDEKNGEINLFPQVLAHWRVKTGPYGDMPAQDWPSLFKTLDNAATGLSASL